MGDFIILDNFFNDTYLSPETKQRWKLLIESLNNKLLTIDPTSVFNDFAASTAVLAVSSRVINCIFLL